MLPQWLVIAHSELKTLVGSNIEELPHRMWSQMWFQNKPIYRWQWPFMVNIGQSFLRIVNPLVKNYSLLMVSNGS